jgi:hypothetical protein
MDNRIRRMEVIDRGAAPAEAEVGVRVESMYRTPTTELRGRLMGPRCPYASTVEVAYPLRPSTRQPPGLEGLSRRVVIPEASLWDPESPFLYQGPVELWQDGRLCDRVVVTMGLRQRGLGPRGLRWNGKPLSLRGREVTETAEPEAAEQRRAGWNLWLAPAEALPGLCDLADRVGFLVLGRLREMPDAAPWHDGLATHPGFLGWLVGQADLERPWLRDFLALPGLAPVGVELDSLPAAPLPEGVRFLVCPADLAADPACPSLPRLLRGPARDGTAGVVLGRIE